MELIRSHDEVCEDEKIDFYAKRSNIICGVMGAVLAIQDTAWVWLILFFMLFEGKKAAPLGCCLRPR